MKFFSIRNKILAALLLLTSGAMILFLWSARSLFERDKTAYLYDANQRAARERALVVNSQLQQWLLSTGALALYVDVGRKSLGAAGEILFQRLKDIEGLAVTEMKPEGLDVVFSKGNDPAFQEAVVKDDLARSLRAGERLPVLHLNAVNGKLYLHQNLDVPGAESRLFYLSFAVNLSKLSPLFGGAGDTRNLLLDRQLDPVLGLDPELGDLWREILSKAKLAGLSDVSQMMSTARGPVLVSFARLADYDYFVAAVTPESVVTRVLRDLSVRTLYLFALVFFAVLAISVFFAHGITSNLQTLMGAMKKVSLGDFDLEMKIKSRDETGQLADGFKVMSGEIQRLIRETAEKSRMESELRTAQAVQSTLFPERHFAAGDFEVAGAYRSASECGGDWWFHSRVGDHLYVVVADATGHGAPAALITSAARAAFSLSTTDGPEGRAPSLAFVASQFNRAIYETSRGRIQMTAILLHIDLKTWGVEAVNCSHEYPLLREPGAESPSTMMFEPVARLGEGPDFEPRLSHFELQRGQAILIYTDGVTDLQSPQGRVFGERRLSRALGAAKGGAMDVVAEIDVAIEKFRAGAELRDDVTLVVIARSGLEETAAHA